MNNKRRNLDQIRKIIVYARQLKIHTLILPYMQPYGPIFSEPSRINRCGIKKYALTTRSGYLRDLMIIARNYGVNIAIPGLIENAGVNKYLSSILVLGSDGGLIRYRKIFLNDYEKKLGLSTGSNLIRFNVHDVSFSTMIDDELFYPELARINLLNTDFLIAGIPQNEPVKKYLSILKTVSQVNQAISIVPGSRVYYEGAKLYYTFPTIIVDENGDVIYRYNDEEQAIVIIPSDRLKRDSRRTSYRESLSLIYSLIKKYLNKRK